VRWCCLSKLACQGTAFHLLGHDHRPTQPKNKEIKKSAFLL